MNKFNGLRHGEEKIIAARSRDIPIVDSKITSLKKPLKLNKDGSPDLDDLRQAAKIHTVLKFTIT